MIDWNAIPEAYRFVAQDASGDLYAYTHEPVRRDKYWYVCDDQYEACVLVARDLPVTDWASSLEARPCFA